MEGLLKRRWDTLNIIDLADLEGEGTIKAETFYIKSRIAHWGIGYNLNTPAN